MVSNKLLATLIISTLVIFITSFFITRGIFQDSHIVIEPSVGKATFDSGDVTVLVFTSVSITTQDGSLINFTDCTAGRPIYSDIADGNAYASCNGYTPQAVITRNDGCIYANVTMNISNWGEYHNGTFLNSATNDSWIAFKVRNVSSHPSYAGGCVNNFQNNWLNISNSSLLNLCDQLESSISDNSLSFDIAFYPPPTTQTGPNALAMTFYASGT